MEQRGDSGDEVGDAGHTVGGRVALQAFPPGRVYSSFLSLLGVLLMCLQRLLRDGDHPGRLSGSENRLSGSVLILKVWLGE